MGFEQLQQKAATELNVSDNKSKGIVNVSVLNPNGSQERIALRHYEIGDIYDISRYITENGYSGLAAALKKNPEEIISEIRKSGLKGRGGAGYATWKKWNA